MRGKRRPRALSAQLQPLPPTSPQHVLIAETVAVQEPEHLQPAAGPLTRQQVEHYEAFGFVTLPKCLLPELPELEREHETALARAYGNDTPESRQTVRMLRNDCPTFMALPESCATLSGGFGAVAEQLYGPDIFCAYMEGNRYVGDTSWHPDYSANYNAPGCRFAFYLDHLDESSGALRIIPSSHSSPLHDTLHEAHQRRGGPGHTTEGIAAEFGYEREEDVPCHVCVSQPGDLTIFDQGCFHAAFGGGARRRMCAAVFYLVPRNATDEKMLRSRAAVNNNALHGHPGGPGYHRDWTQNEGGSLRRARWIDALREYGFDLGS